MKHAIAVALLFCSCSLQTTLRPPQAPCIAPASGPVMLDETGVRELLAGVALEEGDLAAERDRQAKRADIAESQVRGLELRAVLGGTGGAVLAAVIAALVTWGLVR